MKKVVLRRGNNKSKTDVYYEVCCPECKSIRLVQKNNYKNSKYKGLCYDCSREKKNRPERECLRCGGSFRVVNSSARKYCSQECYWETKKGRPAVKEKVMSGRNHWNWRGGISDKDKVERIKFRRTLHSKIMERDGYICQMCGSKKDLQVDHIQSWSEHEELRFNENNCRTLCSQCHYLITFGRVMPEETVAWGHNLSQVMEKEKP